MVRMKRLLPMLVVAALLLTGCQPVRPVSEVGMARMVSITGDIDFAVPDWGLQHGWFRLNVVAPKHEGDAPTGLVRWVEVNANDELRYVMAEPSCLTLSHDGKSALLTLHITSRRGWGDGQADQWVNLWLHDGGSPGAGKDAFATPFWPPQDQNPGCDYVEPEVNIVTAVAGNLVIRH